MRGDLIGVTWYALFVPSFRLPRLSPQRTVEPEDAYEDTQLLYPGFEIVKF